MSIFNHQHGRTLFSIFQIFRNSKYLIYCFKKAYSQVLKNWSEEQGLTLDKKVFNSDNSLKKQVVGVLFCQLNLSEAWIT